ncbi:hemerythrin domain-containing protein [Flagellimonas pelagia]|uniref:Hemerythrin domain-containing protein n=1 Tax=Flagellimonas pelagia TaxID=2306998 RepID=A0A3A1NMP3_9FLAO|nr:hemerythrin domain-containing protein [Allomuricauda maritima]RIV44266.1 hemerythrin domain-containing protein [Allomuricauda maritima]TXJ94182.1 hemerythrin domain-containing protein [Allomuricauda maritima]
MARTPIKRHQALQGVSREHHHGLLLCWKIRTGLSKKVAPERIKQYTDWFYRTYLVPHFELEEQHIFPILGQEHPWIKRALADHRRLTRLFSSPHATLKTLGQIEEELERHIRFEERELFNHLQEVAQEAQMDIIEKHHHHEKFKDNTHDPFWN